MRPHTCRENRLKHHKEYKLKAPKHPHVLQSFEIDVLFNVQRKMMLYLEAAAYTAGLTIHYCTQVYSTLL